MGSRLTAPGPQEKRFAAYMEGLAIAAGHEDRHAPLKNYCRGLLLPGERKSIEPMAALLEPGSVQSMRQSLHHLVAKAPWSDEVLLEQVRSQVLPAMRKHGPVVAWIVDDTGFPKKGTHSVGVARQYCGQVGKQDNCRVAVSLSVATWSASLPVGYRLYLPKEWAEDAKRREEAIGSDPRDAGGKGGSGSRAGRCGLRHPYRVSRRTYRSGPTVCRGRAKHDDGLGTGQAATASQTTRKNGTPAAPVAPKQPASTRLGEAVGDEFALHKMAKHRWIIERDYEELKQELGLGHFEGRNWRGFHHHATLCIAAYGFLVAERNRFSPPPTPAI